MSIGSQRQRTKLHSGIEVRQTMIWVSGGFTSDAAELKIAKPKAAKAG
jgi:hypothetical protein